MTVHNGHKFVNEEEFLSKKKKLWEGHKNTVKKLVDMSTEEHKLRKIKETEDVMYNKAIKAKENIQNRATNEGDQWSKKLVELDEKKRSVNQGINRELRNLDRVKGKFQEIIDVLDLIKTSKDFCQFFERFDELINSFNCDIVHVKSNIKSLSDFSVGDLLVSNFDHLTAKDLEAKISFKIAKQYTIDIRKIICLSELNCNMCY